MAELETANGNVNEAAQYLLGEQSEQIFSTDPLEFSPFSTADSAFFETGQEVNIQKVLKNHAEKVIDTCNFLLAIQSLQSFELVYHCRKFDGK